MTRFLTAFLLISFICNLICQAQIAYKDSCGRYTNPILNSYEIQLLREAEFMVINDKDIDLLNKKVAFSSCGSGVEAELMSKAVFFEILKSGYQGPKV